MGIQELIEQDNMLSALLESIKQDEIRLQRLLDELNNDERITQLLAEIAAWDISQPLELT